MDRRKQAEAQEWAALDAALRSQLLRVARARAAFAEQTEPLLLEAAVYEIKAGQSMYAYLMRQARERGFYNDYPPIA